LLAGRIPARGWSWERIHVECTRDALTLAAAEGWDGIQAVSDELAGGEDPVVTHGIGGTPLEVIWGVPQRSRLPGPRLRAQAGSQQLGGCHARRQRPGG
jgi:hypothetical protein